MKSSISALWSAKSVAIIGATERAGAMGRLPLEYLQKYGFAGEIFPVNPKGGEVLGLKAFENVKNINNVNGPQQKDYLLNYTNAVPNTTLRETFENVKFKWMSDRNEIYINEDIDFLTLDIINVVESNIFQVINDKGIVSVINLNEGSQSIKISVKNTNKIVIESGFFIPSKTNTF